MNNTLFNRTLLIAGLVSILLNTQLLHFDEEFFIGVFSCIFFFTLYKLARSTITLMFFGYCDVVYVTLAFLMHTILMVLNLCQQLLNWTILKLQANELWSLISYNKLLRILTLGRGHVNSVIGTMILAAFVQSPRTLTH